MRQTYQKQLIWDTVMALHHPTAEEVYEEAQKHCPRLSRGTVYRHLLALIAQKCLLKVVMPDHSMRFDKIKAAHYHAVCDSCGAFFDIALPYQTHLDGFCDETGAMIKTHTLFFHGICNNCQQKERKTT